ncbi:MAG: 2-hydroxy-3-keto-5-methylthiopentenyl-1-phosphate phosphatase [Cyanobacteria bacterium QS_8_64_29]|nr:MAG: 2-hydroxy-3-keto-5-methylthiopentenyl-1-phosphate phosphatase [Cyanobacteria bacterium QS_8_64_29]
MPAKAPTEPALQRAVFCDFDGTITAEDTFSVMLQAFAPAESARLLPELYAGRIALRTGVRQALEAIPSRHYPAMVAHADSQPLRPGLSELLDFLDARGIPLHVVSGGLRGMVERVLSRQRSGDCSLLERVASVSALELNASSEYLRVRSAFEGGDELVSKVQVMAQSGARERIAIGDSLTDLNMARAADLTFARDRLGRYLQAENVAYVPWNDFFQVRAYLAQWWEAA